MTKMADEIEQEVIDMGALKKIETEIDDLLNCDYEPGFQIKPLTDLPVGDGSLHYRLSCGNNHVDFGICNSGVFEGEMAAYSWHCPNEGRMFLQTLEEYATKKGLKLTIPTVLNPKLESILGDCGYTMKCVPYRDDVCELWSKD